MGLEHQDARPANESQHSAAAGRHHAGHRARRVRHPPTSFALRRSASLRSPRTRYWYACTQLVWTGARGI